MINNYSEFEKFYQERLNAIPWDHEYNKGGFRPEVMGKSSDISAHLPMLRFLASQVDCVTEFGSRFCSSTSAFISGGTYGPMKVVSYDICRNHENDLLLKWSAEKKLPRECLYEFNLQDTSKKFDMGMTDLLFLDTLHTYNQVVLELKQAYKVRKYLVFHDTYSQGLISVDRPGEIGILPAIEEFLNEHDSWEQVYKADFNHGLIVLERSK
jgi:cephalosporin hydroxylase